MIEIHSFIRQRPDAVFLMRTHLRTLDDPSRALKAGHRAAEVIFQKASPQTPKRKIVLKPNITTGPELDAQTLQPYPDQDGVVTNPYFVAGFVDGIRTLDNAPILMAEGSSLQNFVARGHAFLLKEREVELISLTTPRLRKTTIPPKDSTGSGSTASYPGIFPLFAP